MDWSSIAAGVFSGGTIASVFKYLGDRKKVTDSAKKSEEKNSRDRLMLPFEMSDRQLAILQQQVLLLSQINTAMQERIKDLEEDLEKERDRVTDRDSKIDLLEGSLADMRFKVTTLQKDCDRMQSEITSIRNTS